MIRTAPMVQTASMIQTAALGTFTLYQRRLAVATKTASGIAGTMTPPVLWVLLIAPALDTALGDFSPDIDYFTYVAVAQVALIVPFTSMFSGINVIVDKEFGILREFLVAPVFRPSIPLANALAVLTIASVQVALIIGLGTARGAEFNTSATGVLWFISAVGLLSLTTYAIAEVLALAVGRQEAFGPLIPAVGVTPWFLSGSLFPLDVLPPVVEQIALAFPWTHALALMRYGMMEDTDPGLANIWHMDSEPLMAALSLGVLVLMAGAALAIAIRVFNRKTMA
jgi:ABC-2 type transport system permease protein